MNLATKKTIELCPYTAPVSWPPSDLHKQTFYKFCFIERGGCKADFYDKNDEQKISVDLKEGDAFIIRSFDTQSYVANDLKAYLHRDIYLDEKQLKEACDFVSPDLFDEIKNSEFPPQFKINSPTIIYLAERCTFLSGPETSVEKDAIHKTLITTLLSHYISYKYEKDSYPIWINALLRDLNSEKFVVLSIEEMVKTTNYSHGYVNREFKKYLGCSLKQFANNRKLAFASIMLATTDIPLQDIVDKLGFTTLSNFINVFKDKYGITPAKYRRTQGKRISKDYYTEWDDMASE